MNIRFDKAYKSIQKGFEWKDVPNFAIITGINGVGKSQLLDAIKINNPEIILITDDGGNAESIVVNDLNATKQSIEGLIKYKNNYVARQATKKEQENLISTYGGYLNKALDKLSSTTDEIERQRILNDVTRNENLISNCNKKIDKLFEYAYEEELETISEKVGKEPKDLTDEEVRANANPYFNTLTEIEDFERYVKQEHEERNERLGQLSKKKDYDKLREEGDKEYAHNIINSFFHKFGFDYFEMQDPFDEGSKHRGKVWFKGQMGEEVEYNDLSSGEQMIVKYLFWTLGKDFRGNRINTMLLDEPDNHLHPSMCQMMVNILYELSKPKSEGGSGIRIIITTHSPSTVAFAPEGNLFVMEKNDKNERSIRSVSTEEAEDVLSEGIFTFRKGINTINIALATRHKNLLFVEGDTDIVHLRKAIKLLELNLDIEILSLDGASCLEAFIKITPSKFFDNKKMIALFDCDDEGRKSYNSITGDEVISGIKRLSATHCEGRVFALNIKPVDENLSIYCPIEFLYPKSYLDDKGILDKRNLKEFINKFEKLSNNHNEMRALTEEHEKGLSLRPFTINKEEKKQFSNIIKNETDPAIFEGFRPTLELIQQVIEL